MKGKKKFVIGFLPDGLHSAFIHGPYDTIKEVLEEWGGEGEYIFVLQIDRVPKVIRWWDNATDEWKGF